MIAEPDIMSQNNIFSIALKQITELDEKSFIDFIPNFIDTTIADVIFNYLQNDISWHTVERTDHNNIKYNLPRLQNWMAHSVPPEKVPLDPRINLTFRKS